MDRRGFLKNLGVGAVSLAVLGNDSFGQKESVAKTKVSSLISL